MEILLMPIEIISLITELLDIDDLFNLRLSCRHFGYVFQDNGLCRLAFKKARFSSEYKDAQATGVAYAHGLRRFIKRKTAVRSAKPFLVSVVAVADNFVFANGAICYTYDRERLRVLLLKGTVTHELQINTRQLLLAAIPGSRKKWKYRSKPLYHADGILSCLYTHSKQGVASNWLVVLGTEPVRVLSVRELDSATGIFVRNNADHLYCGTKSEHTTDRYRRWVLRGLDLRTGKWASDRFVLWDFVGAEMGSTICFEIFDGFLYGLSSQTMFEPAEDKWNSFYYAFRFVLGNQVINQVLERPAAWRRQAREGPIDDRWSLLELSRDEASGKIYIFESRKEWLPINSQSQRTCYRKELVFPPVGSDSTQTFSSGPITLRDPEGWDREMHQEARSPEDRHVGDNGSSGITFTFNDTLARSYNASCRSFVDMVSDPSAATPAMQRLRLRVRPQALDFSQAKDQVDQQTEQHVPIGGQETTWDDEVRLWPPDQDPERPDPLLHHLEYILNPQFPADHARYAADERTIVYSPRSSNKNQLHALILISFDPGLRLPGLRKLRGGYGNPFYVDAGPSDATPPVESTAEEEVISLSESSSTLAELSKSVAPQVCQATSVKDPTQRTVRARKSTTVGWASMESPFYLSIGDAGLGFDMTR